VGYARVRALNDQFNAPLPEFGVSMVTAIDDDGWRENVGERNLPATPFYPSDAA
jgi:hypothetical protein